MSDARSRQMAPLKIAATPEIFSAGHSVSAKWQVLQDSRVKFLNPPMNARPVMMRWRERESAEMKEPSVRTRPSSGGMLFAPEGVTLGGEMD